MRDVMNTLLNLPIEVPVWFVTFCLGLMFIGFGMMLTDAISRRSDSPGAPLLLVAALVYGAFHIGLFVITLMIDAFAIFETIYILAAVPGVPLLTLGIFFTVGQSPGRYSRRTTTGFVMWVVGFALFHLFAIGQAAAGV